MQLWVKVSIQVIAELCSRMIIKARPVHVPFIPMKYLESTTSKMVQDWFQVVEKDWELNVGAELLYTHSDLAPTPVSPFPINWCTCCWLWDILCSGHSNSTPKSNESSRCKKEKHLISLEVPECKAQSRKFPALPTDILFLPVHWWAERGGGRSDTAFFS